MRPLLSGNTHISLPSRLLILSSLVTLSCVGLTQEPGVESSVEFNAIKDDNIYRTVDKISDSIGSLTPKLTYIGLYGKQQLRAEYLGNYQVYMDNSELNYLDHDISLKALLDHSYKLTSEFSFGYEDKIEQPGSTDAISTVTANFNETSNTALTASVLYGTEKSEGQIVVRLDHNKFRYTNNQQQFRDYDQDRITGTFYYRLASKTRLLLEASASNLDYENKQVFDLSSKQNFYLAGVEWAATAVTSSVFKIGYQNRDYDNDSLSSLSGLSYFVDLYWRPNTYSLVKISASRQAKESAEQSIGGFLSDEYSINISHEFTETLALSAGYSYTGYDYDNSQSREDKYQDLHVKLSYQAKNWLSLHIGIERIQRASTVDIYEFDANIINIGTVIGFD